MESDAGIDPAAEVPSKGVRKRGDKWVAEIRNRRLKRGRHPGRKWLGTFSSAAEAREAYLLAVKKIKQPQKTSKSARARSPEGSEPSNSHSSSSPLFIRRGLRRRREAEENDQQLVSRTPRSKRFLSINLREEAAVAGPADSTEWSSSSDLPPSPEPKGIKRKVSNQSLNVPAKGIRSHPAVSLKSAAVTSEDALHALREFQQASCSTPCASADALNFSYSEFCTSASPSSSSTSSLFDEEIENQRPNNFFRRKPGDIKQGGDSVNEVDEGDPKPETAQAFTDVTDRVAIEPVPPSAEMGGASSLFTYISGLVLDDYVKFAAVPREGTHCALGDQASVSNLCPCSLMFIDNQKHCPTSVCLWKHSDSCPLAGGNREENIECLSSNQRQDDRYLVPDHFDDLRIRTKNFSALKTKQLISELEAELFVDAGHPTVPQAPAESSGNPSPAIPVRRGK